MHFEQFIRTKRARFEVKVYELCSCSRRTLDSLVYSGKGIFSDDDPNDDIPSSEKGPSILIQPFLGKCIYYISSLGKSLSENKTNLCGAIHSN